MEYFEHFEDYSSSDDETYKYTLEYQFAEFMDKDPEEKLKDEYEYYTWLKKAQDIMGFLSLEVLHRGIGKMEGYGQRAELIPKSSCTFTDQHWLKIEAMDKDKRHRQSKTILRRGFKFYLIKTLGEKKIMNCSIPGTEVNKRRRGEPRPELSSRDYTKVLAIQKFLHLWGLHKRLYFTESDLDVEKLYVANCLNLKSLHKRRIKKGLAVAEEEPQCIDDDED